MSHAVAWTSAERECISSAVFLGRHAIDWRPKKTTLEMYFLAAAYSRKKHFSIDFFGPRRCTGGSWARRFASVSVKWTFPMWECWHFEPLLSEDIFVTNVKATDLESTWKTHQVLLQLCHENVIWEERLKVLILLWENGPFFSVSDMRITKSHLRPTYSEQLHQRKYKIQR